MIDPYESSDLFEDSSLTCFQTRGLMGAKYGLEALHKLWYPQLISTTY
jgi:hypothetical protein